MKVNNVAVTSGSASAPIALAVGTTAVTVLVTAQDGSTTRTYTLSVTRAKAITAVTLAASNAAPLFGTSFTLTASVSGASPTGTVQFSELSPEKPLGSATLANGAATITVAGLSVGAHQIVATYKGDASNAAQTSAPLVVTVNGRPDPGRNPTVRSLVTTQAQTAQRFAQAQIDNVATRLERMHDSGDESAPPITPLTAIGGSARGGAPGRSADLGSRRSISLAEAGGEGFPSAQPTANFADSPMWDMSKPLAYADPLSRRQAQSDAAQAVQAVAGLLPGSVAMLNRQQILPFGVWAAGGLGFGRLRPDGAGSDNRFTSSGLTIGADRLIADGFRAGAAFGVAFDSAKIGSDGSKIDSRGLSGTLYASWRFMPQFFIDATVGYGRTTFDSRRWDVDGGVMLDGARAGNSWGGSLALTHEMRMGAWSLAPFARVQVLRTDLAPYTETGDSVWALAFSKAHTTSLAGVLGGRVAYDVPMSWGVLTPGARVEWRHEFDGGITQNLQYADLVGVIPDYTVKGSGLANDNVSFALSLRARTGENLTLDFDYRTSLAAGRFQSHLFSGAARYRF